jgi:hypothetical protein
VVEEVKGKVAGIEFMDYVAAGKVIKLGATDSIVLGYMKSCWRETITGGVVVVGEEHSLIHAGRIERQKVDCDASHMRLGAREASQSAATVFRGIAPDQQAAVRPPLTLYGLSPLVEVSTRGTLRIERLDRPGERHQVALGGKSLVRGKFYDFARARTALTPGGVYAAHFGAHTTVFRIDPRATPGSGPIVGRLLRLP